MKGDFVMKQVRPDRKKKHKLDQILVNWLSRRERVRWKGGAKSVGSDEEARPDLDSDGI